MHIRSRPKNSIVIGYIIDECLGFASMYFGEGIDTKRRRLDRNFDKLVLPHAKVFQYLLH